MRGGTRRIVPVRSLRWRVTATVVAVVAVTLLVAGLVVDLALTAALDRDQQTRLAERSSRLDGLVAQGVPADQLVALLDGQGVRAVRLSPTGTVLQGVAGPPKPPHAGPDGPGADRHDSDGPDGGPGRPGPRAPGPGVDKTLADGTVVHLSVDPGEVDTVVHRLRGVLIGVGLVGLAISAVVLFSGVSAALRPLDAMTRVARAITNGDRDRRLRPTTTDTEIGRTAAAFDEMLDALDAARQRAEASAREALDAATSARAAEQEARRSEATTRRFLSDAAHELRTPLAGMQTLAETLVRDSDEDRETREELAIALVRETSRASSLVTDMLDLARIEGGAELDRHPVDLTALATDQVGRLRLVDPGLDVAVVADGPVVVPGEEDKLRRVLVNLLDNARRHVRGGGAVRVTVGAGDDAGARLVVHNDGEPVAEADRERIFDRLVRLDSARARDSGGAGLGLAIARALVRAHDGELTYRAAADGSDLVVELPTDAPG
ncbi:cell wall metabolism sensor histidine kinase WalK [Actinomycetospora sp. TBRC 11914]|uniref:sensor histidine kinase n=1 Tax=Actinomycetospora sp. TBRC 11914 TaxID=2729387 RepID=UPI00145E37DA|nr:HAMP domain-containing sensor histidine kinase [Actinomycetospora sp. TBRC 11914]NMO88616.1 HAMP domain-containing histidine kinase [Actinomycetospora sp. TBRC 11914]